MGNIIDSNKTDDNDNTTVVIKGEDNQYAADVVQESGINKLVVKTSNELSSALRITQEYDQGLVLSDVTYSDLYTATGIKTISGFQIQFDDKKVWIRLEIDGQEIFNINVEKLKDISDWNSFAQPQSYISWNDMSKVFYFTPNFPITSSTSIKIQARSKLGKSKKYQGSLIQVG